MRKFEYLFLFIVVLLALSLRLYRVDNPVADWHSWRQADTSAVSRNFIKFGFDPLHPRFDDLSNVPSGKDNPQGWRFVEFPIYNLLSAGATQNIGIFSLELWERLISILSSLGSLIFLYLLVKKYLGRKIGLWSAFFFAVLPYNIYFSRVILPEPSMVFTSLGMIYFFDRWLEEKKKTLSIFYYLISVLLAAIAILIKPYTGFIFLPIFYLVWRKWGPSLIFKPSLYLYLLLALAPFIWWREWMSQFPEGIPDYKWLFNAGNIRFKGAFFYWIFADRIGRLILGYFGTVFLVLGFMIRRNKKEGLFFDFWMIAILIYFTILAAGNVRHDYYQAIAIPIICVFMAKGVNFLIDPPPKEYFNKLLNYPISIICLFFLLGFGWYSVRDYFNINNSKIVLAGKAVDQLTPKDAKVIAPYGGDTAFLYQTNRQGWPVGFEIEDKIKKGATYYVNVNFNPESDYVEKKYKVVEKTNDFVIVKLQ